MFTQKVSNKHFKLILTLLIVFILAVMINVPAKAETLGNEKIANWSFETVKAGASGWYFEGAPDLWAKYVTSAISSYVQFGLISEDTYERSKCLKISITNFGTTIGGIQLFTNIGIPLTEGKVYKLSFAAKSSKNIDIEGNDNANLSNIALQDTQASNKSCYSKIVNPDSTQITNQWNVYEYYITASASCEKARVIFFLGKMPVDSADIYIDAVSLKEVMDEPDSYNVTLGIEGAAMDDVALTGGGTISKGTDATIKAAVKQGKNYVFEKWVDAGNNTISTNPVYKFPVNSNIAYKAVFKPLPKYTVSANVNNSSLGSISQSGGQYDYGSSVTLAATPASGSKFVCWQENGNEVSTEPNYTFMVKGNHYITAHFAEEGKHKVIFKDEGGRILKVESVANGQSATEPADISKSGYIFEGWDKAFNNITADTIVTAIYKQPDITYIEFVMPTIDNNMTLFAQEMVQNALSGTETRDLIFTNHQRIMPALVEDGYFLALDDYVSQDSDVWKELIVDYTSWRGKRYGLTEVGKEANTHFCVIYNKQIMDRNGIPEIWSYVDAGAWTWQTFLDTAIATTQDADGDGKVDQWGVAAGVQYLGDSLLYSNGGRYFNENTYELAINSEKAQKALYFMSDLYNVYKVSGFTDGNWVKCMQKGQGAMTFYRAGWFPGYFADPNIVNDLICAPIPKGPDMDKHIVGYNQQNEMFAFPSSVKDPESVITVLSDLFYTKFLDMKKANHIQMVAEIWFKDSPHNIELMTKMQEIGIPINEPVNIFGNLASTVYNDVYTKVIKQETPVTSALSASEGLLQSIIENTLNR